MKNTARIRRKSITKRAPVQAVDSSNQSQGYAISKFQQKCRMTIGDNLRGFIIQDPQSHPTCLALFCRETGKPVNKIPISEYQFLSLVKYSAKFGKPLNEFIAQIILYGLDLSCTCPDLFS